MNRRVATGGLQTLPIKPREAFLFACFGDGCDMILIINLNDGVVK